jgi:hypothetical protein
MQVQANNLAARMARAIATTLPGRIGDWEYVGHEGRNGSSWVTLRNSRESKALYIHLPNYNFRSHRPR